MQVLSKNLYVKCKLKNCYKKIAFVTIFTALRLSHAIIMCNCNENLNLYNVKNQIVLQALSQC